MDKPRRRAPEATRKRLLRAAFAEFHEFGFQSTGLDAILARADLTKGAIYHHFKNKTELGHAVFDEVIAPRIRERWIAPVHAADDPVETLTALVRAVARRPARERSLGCPLNNLVQESPGLDEGFRQRMNAFLDDWRAQLSADLRRAQQAGQVRGDLRPTETAAFVVAALEGVVGLAKPAADPRALRQTIRGFVGYLESLRT